MGNVISCAIIKTIARLVTSTLRDFVDANYVIDKTISLSYIVRWVIKNKQTIAQRFCIGFSFTSYIDSLSLL